MTSRLLPVLVGAAALTLLAGCSMGPGLGGGGSAPGSAGGTASSTAGAAGGDSSAGSGGGSAATGTCALLSPSKLSSITGKHYDHGDELSPDGFGGAQCTYDGGISVEVNTGDFTSEQQFMVSSTGAVSVPGLGDSAFYAAPSSDDNQQEILIVITGTKLVQV
ncbi:MAG: hypothetical protein ABJA11_04315, partial [Pseudolysinimonas sp.]